MCVYVCVFTSGAGGLGDWAGSLHGLKTDPAGKEKLNMTQSFNITWFVNVIMTMRGCMK